MARFDLYKVGEIWVVDCQSDLLDGLQTRFVIPLLGTEKIAAFSARLNPEFDIEGTTLRLFPQGAATLSRRELGQRHGSLAEHGLGIIDAIDMLVSGA